MRHALTLLTACLFLPVSPPTILSAVQPVEGLVNIRFQVDVRVFAVMAAINAAGFDLDAEDLGQNLVRKVTREGLSKMDPDLRDRLHAFYAGHRAGLDDSVEQSKYVSLSLLLNGPPGFALAVKPDEVPPDVSDLIGFERLIEEVWKEGVLPRLWEQLHARYGEEIEFYRPLIRRMVIEVLQYLRTDARIALDRQVTFVPDLLNGFGAVNARNIGTNYVVVVGPSRTRQPPMRGLRHEYLHFLLDPLVVKYRGQLPDPEPFLKSAHEQPRAVALYEKDFLVMLTESLIKALELGLARESSERATALLIENYEQGLILVPYFLEAVERFEKGTESFQEFFPGVIDGIRWDREGGRKGAMAALRNELQARADRRRATESSQERMQDEIRGWLANANRHLLAKEFDQAKSYLERVLDKDPGNPNALFGMAQIASHDQDLDRALELYERAATSARTEAWIAGWALVHRGNIHSFRGDQERAAAEWAKVLQLSGDLRGAAEAAAKALKKK